jgi:selenocysteine lyase/cysteine desulfurase
MEAGRIIQSARDNLTRLFNIDDPSRISFALNVTEALNTVFHGYLNPGDHVVTTAMEHNSVMRPLSYLHERGTLRSISRLAIAKGFWMSMGWQDHSAAIPVW